MFNINFTYLLNILLPPILRQSKMIAWLKVITSYLHTIYNEFVIFRSGYLAKLYHTGQVIYLEKILNDLFSTTGIYISDGVILEQVYFSNISESEFPTYLNNISENEQIFFLYNFSEIQTNADFNIYIPTAFYISMTTQQLNQLYATVEYYKEFNKTYTIKTY